MIGLQDLKSIFVARYRKIENYTGHQAEISQCDASNLIQRNGHDRLPAQYKVAAIIDPVGHNPCVNSNDGRRFWLRCGCRLLRRRGSVECDRTTQSEIGRQGSYPILDWS